MTEAVIIHWDSIQRAGVARSSHGRDYHVLYINGQSFSTCDDSAIPVLSGKHAQGHGYALKVPEVGDPVLMDLHMPNDEEPIWGYMRHYIELVEGRYGTRFLLPQH